MDGRWEWHPLTPERWPDLERLFAGGVVAGCWCMFWRLTGREFSRGWGEGNRRALRALVDTGRIPGILAYRDGEPVGWCSVGPREDFGRLNRSPTLRPVDGCPVWSIVCFYVAPGERRQGLMVFLIRAAAEYAAACGARAVEAYPLEGPGQVPAGEAFTGLAEAFRRAGFTEAARRSRRRPILRLELAPGPHPRG